VQCGKVTEARPEDCQECQGIDFKAFDPNPPKPPPKPVEAPKPNDKSRDITAIKSLETDLIVFGMPEIERVLGGGLVKGSVAVLTGEPGIGKSTLLTMIAAKVAAIYKGRPGCVVYASAEERNSRIAARAKRIGYAVPGLRLLETTQWEDVESCVQIYKPALLIGDSVSAFETVDGVGGKVQRIERIANRTIALSHALNMASILVAHVTKEGDMSGPKTLEHMVDFYGVFSGDRTKNKRYFYAPKNRDGAVGEVATMEMTREGLIEVPSAAKQLLQYRAVDMPGSVIFPTTDIGNVSLMEIEVKVSGETTTEDGKPIGPLPRIASVTGISSARIPRLVTLIGEAANLLGSTIHIEANHVGDFQIGDEASDLAVAAAIMSSRINRVLGLLTVVLGSVSVTGRVKPIENLRARLEEAHRAGFTQAIIPGQQVTEVPASLSGMEIVGIEHLRDLMPWLIRHAAKPSHIRLDAPDPETFLIQTS
jgi:DNA repair protein RadA/Sms